MAGRVVKAALDNLVRSNKYRGIVGVGSGRCHPKETLKRTYQPIRVSLDKTLGSALFLHKLLELSLYYQKGVDFVNVRGVTPEDANRAFSDDHTPHLQAVLFHCEYLQAAAGCEGVE